MGGPGHRLDRRASARHAYLLVGGVTVGRSGHRKKAAATTRYLRALERLKLILTTGPGGPLEL